MLPQSALSCIRRTSRHKWHFSRFVSSKPMKMHRYMVWAPDYTNEGTLARRMAIRPKHFVDVNKVIEQGALKVAGGLLAPGSEDAEPQDREFVGSALIYEAESFEEARRLVEADVYWKENVWDKERLVILPILMATTLPERTSIAQPAPKGED